MGVPFPAVGIPLAVKFQEDYSTEQHYHSENYYGDNFVLRSKAIKGFKIWI